ncbi:MAG: PQQ-dependent sugar dehydrogenase [Chloroflexi bacterium]|nr:PQQ-dependent sugar dehydrogenase [Chloroflexota bacterium]
MNEQTRAGKWLAVVTILLGVVGLGLVWAGLSFSSIEALVVTPQTGWPNVAMTAHVSGLMSPAAIAHAGDGSGRLFVIEQPGRIRIVRDGVVLETPFLDITDRVSCCGERGLLSVAFPPEYAAKGHFYVYYTDLAGNSIVARYRLAEDADIADAASEEILITIEQPTAEYCGGQLAFGPDGYLYIGVGGGRVTEGYYPDAQNGYSLLGKVLRVDVESGEQPYGIPPDNPYVGEGGYRAEIWALGLRNPRFFAFCPVTGALYLVDSGQPTCEEINFQAAGSGGGSNYGWPVMEGFRCLDAEVCGRQNEGRALELPVAVYDHTQGCAIAGGVVYRGALLYGDYCSGHLWALEGGASSRGWRVELVMDTGLAIVALGVDEEGNLYIADQETDTLYAVHELP